MEKTSSEGAYTNGTKNSSSIENLFFSCSATREECVVHEPRALCEVCFGVYIAPKPYRNLSANTYSLFGAAEVVGH